MSFHLESVKVPLEKLLLKSWCRASDCWGLMVSPRMVPLGLSLEDSSLSSAAVCCRVGISSCDEEIIPEGSSGVFSSGWMQLSENRARLACWRLGWVVNPPVSRSVGIVGTWVAWVMQMGFWMLLSGVLAEGVLGKLGSGLHSVGGQTTT